MLPAIKEFAKKHYIGLSSFLIFIIYLLTLAPSVVEIDSGELATVQSVLGIAHPTGYPLFTILGYLFLKIPLPAEIIYRVNLLAAIYCALGIWIFMKSVLIILQNSFQNVLKDAKMKKTTRNKVEETVNIPSFFYPLVTLLSGLVLAFSRTYWMQSTSVEVYSLQVFLFGLIIYSTLNAYFSKRDSLKQWIWFGFALAFGFSNHMTTLLVLPFSAILFFHKEKFNNASLKKILFSFAAFLPTIVILYSYLPLRASINPIMNWGNPINFENFFRHISGKQYQVWMFASLESAKKHLGTFLENFPAEFGYVGLLMGLAGIFLAYKKARLLFSAVVITLILGVLYVINYDISDLDSYFLLPCIMFSFLISFGFAKLILDMQKKLVNVKYVIASTSIIALFPLVLNYSETDQSGVNIFEDYTHAVVNSTEKNSLILSYQWDYFVAASYYFQNIEGFRNDVTIIDKELLRRSWYYNQLKRNHPGIFSGMEGEISNFLDAVKPFERDEKFSPDVIERCYRTVMTKLVETNIGKKSVYLGIELLQNEMQRGEFALPNGYQLIPDLFLLKVVKGNEYVPAPLPYFTLRMPRHSNKYTEKIQSFVAGMLVYRAIYELQFNKEEQARIYINKVRSDFPDYQIPEFLINKIQ